MNVGDCKMNDAFYPVLEEEWGLPVCVFGVGRTSYQYHVIREEGYSLPQFNFCKKGEGLLIVGEKEYQIRENMSFFLPSDTPHEYYTTGGYWHNYWVTFGGRFANEILEQLNLTKPVILTHMEFTPLMQEWERIFNKLKNTSLSGNYLASGYMYNYILEYANEKNMRNQKDNSAGKESFLSVLKFIDDNYMKELTLEELADQIDVSKQYLCRMFQENIKMRPFQYITKKRMQIAKMLLMKSSYSINDIAMKVGYQDCSYFCRLFKEYEHMTPKSFASRGRKEAIILSP